MSQIATREQAIERGTQDGIEAVQTYLQEQAPDRADLHAVSYGQSQAWDAPAINAGAAHIVGVSEEHEQAYYEAYQAAALREAREAYDRQQSE